MEYFLTVLILISIIVSLGLINRRLSSKPNVDKMLSEKNVKALIRALRHPDGFTRSKAATALGDIGDIRAVEPLIQSLETDWKLNGEALAEALGKLRDPRAVEPLIQFYNNNNDEWRAAVKSLSKIRDVSAVEPFIHALRHKSNTIRCSAATALGEIRDIRGVEPLVQSLRDEDSNVREIASKALDKLGWQPDEMLDKIYYLFAQQKWGDLTDMGTPAIETLLKGGLTDRDRKQAALALGKISACQKVADAISEKALLHVIRIHDYDAVYTASKSILKQEKQMAINVLREALKYFSDNPLYKYVERESDVGFEGHRSYTEKIDIRSEIMKDLATLGDVDHLLKLLEENKEEEIKVIEALGSTKDGRAVDPLIVVLKDKNMKYGRLCAAEALGKIGDSRAIEQLIGVAFEGDFRLREKAVQALKMLNWRPQSKEHQVLLLIASGRWDEVQKIGTSAVEPVIMALKCGDCYLEGRAAEVLGKMGDNRAVEPLIAALGGYAGKEAAEALGRIGDNRAVPALIAALKNRFSSCNERDSIMLALRKMRDTRAIIPLLEAYSEIIGINIISEDHMKWIIDDCIMEPLIALISRDNMDRVWHVAELLLDEIIKKKDIRAVEPLIGALRHEDPRARCRAAEALGKIGDKRAIEPLMIALKDKESLVTAYAKSALRQITNQLEEGI